ncbi:LysR family transcriptional regulator [Paraferrimonas sp. SM1919]|uniref:LysR family transcriptional regulator n=1 Tax=Paraferrimonas sp. SM1919 TaxID=2662263 RepID=UPI0013D313E4|nr:LysR family transcriptional regulator [Paraferrimonas sp. SM1919]
MQLSLEQLEAFVTAVETGSFSAAARKLGKAQSSVSGLINNLEIDTGFELFDRSKRSPTLTKEGLALLNDIKSVTKSHNNLLRRIDNMIEDVETEISFAYDEFALPEAYLLKLLEEFDQEFENTSLLLLCSSHNQASTLLKQGKVDIALSLSKDDYPEEFAFKGVAHSHYCTVVSKNHPLAKLNSVSPTDLSQYRHIRVTDSDTGFRRFDSQLSSKIWYSNSAAMLLHSVQAGLGWADLPLTLIETQLKSGELVRLPTCHQSVTYPHCVDIIWHSQSANGKCLQWLIKRLTQLGAQSS